MLIPVAVILFLCGAALAILGGLWSSSWERVVCVALGIGVMLFSVLLAVAIRPVVKRSAEEEAPGPESRSGH